MAQYSIDFSTNALKVVRSIEELNQEIATLARTGKSIKINLDTTQLNQQIGTTFKKLDKEIARYQRQLRKLQIGSPEFISKAGEIGQRQGVRERGRMQAEAASLRQEAFAFESGSAVALQKLLRSLRIEAQQIKPDTQEWVRLQQRIAQVNNDLKKGERLAESIQLTEDLNAFSPQSLNALEAKLTILRNRAREIAPDTMEWKELNKEIVKAERNIEKQTRRPMTRGQRLGAAGGAFLYGGGMGGGVGSAVGGIAGGLMGGVPGAFTGAALGQMADNLGGIAANVTQAAASIAQLQRGLALASIDAKDFSEAQKAIKESSDTLVVPLDQVYRQFTQLRVNTKQYGLSVKDTQEILEGTVLAVSSVGGSLEDVDGAMRAVVQIFSKGKVQAEELRGQLGERFPGAVIKFAQANNMSFTELQEGLEKGEIGIREFVEFAKKNYEDYAKFSEQLATAPEFAGRRLEKAMNDMQIAIGSALGPAGAEFQDFFTETITGFTNWVNENKEFIGEYLKDWAKLVTDFARIVGGIVKVAVQVSTAIIKAFRGAIYEIRRLLGMVGVAEIKAQLDEVNKKIEEGGAEGERRGAAKSALETRRDQLQAQFEAAGGQAALDAAAGSAATDLVFGGPGAGMSLDTAGSDSGKAKKGKELKDFAEDEVRILKERLALQKNLIDVQANLTSSQKELIKAELEYEYGLDIVEAQYKAAISTLNEYKEAQRGAAQASMQNAAVLARENVTAEYRKALLGDLIKDSDSYEGKIADLQDNIAALKAGTEDLSAAEQLEASIKRRTIGFTKEQLAIIEPYLAKLREQAGVLDSLLQLETQLRIEREKGQNLSEARKQLGVIGAGLSAGFTGSAAGVFEQAMAQFGDRDYATQMADLETAAMQLRSVFEGVQGAIQGVSGSIASLFTEGIAAMVTGTATAKEVFASFLQSVAQALSQAAAQMIATYIAIGIAKMFAGLGGGVSGANYSSGNVATNAFQTNTLGLGPSLGTPGTAVGFTFANGGIAPGGFQAFANGGVVSGPTLGLVGEGRYNEAIVPLPDGKSIPVQLKYDASRKAVANAENNAGISSIDYEDPLSTGGASTSRQSLSSKAAQAVMETRMQVMEQRSYSEKRSEMRQIEEMVARPAKIDVEYQSQVINNVEYVTREQAERMASQSALRGRELAIGALQNSVKARKRVGMA